MFDLYVIAIMAGVVAFGWSVRWCYRAIEEHRFENTEDEWPTAPDTAPTLPAVLPQ
jgi:hypothetical protein